MRRSRAKVTSLRPKVTSDPGLSRSIPLAKVTKVTSAGESRNYVKRVNFGGLAVLQMIQALQPARAAFLRRIGRVGLDLRLLRLARFLVRSLLSLGHRRSPARRDRAASALHSRPRG